MPDLLLCLEWAFSCDRLGKVVTSGALCEIVSYIHNMRFIVRILFRVANNGDDDLPVVTVTTRTRAMYPSPTQGGRRRRSNGIRSPRGEPEALR